jgi:hypothetical protein
MPHLPNDLQHTRHSIHGVPRAAGLRCFTESGDPLGNTICSGPVAVEVLPRFEVLPTLL